MFGECLTLAHGEKDCLGPGDVHQRSAYNTVFSEFRQLLQVSRPGEGCVFGGHGSCLLFVQAADFGVKHSSLLSIAQRMLLLTKDSRGIVQRRTEEGRLPLLPRGGGSCLYRILRCFSQRGRDLRTRVARCEEILPGWLRRRLAREDPANLASQLPR